MCILLQFFTKFGCCTLAPSDTVGCRGLCQGRELQTLSPCPATCSPPSPVCTSPRGLPSPEPSGHPSGQPVCTGLAQSRGHPTSLCVPGCSRGPCTQSVLNKDMWQEGGKAGGTEGEKRRGRRAHGGQTSSSCVSISPSGACSWPENFWGLRPCQGLVSGPAGPSRNPLPRILNRPCAAGVGLACPGSRGLSVL